MSDIEELNKKLAELKTLRDKIKNDKQILVDARIDVLRKERTERNDKRGLIGIEIELRHLNGEKYKSIQKDLNLSSHTFNRCRQIYSSFIYRCTGEFY